MSYTLNKIADLATYLDERGHKEESHVLDHVLHALAAGEEPPSWFSPIDRIRWEMSHAGGKGEAEEYGTSLEGRKMLKEIEEVEKGKTTHQEPPTTQTPGQDKPATGKDFVVVEVPGFEPIKVNKVSDVVQLSKNPKVSSEVLIKSIYDSVQAGAGDAAVQSGKTLQDALKLGVNAKVLQDDRWWWQK